MSDEIGQLPMPGADGRMYKTDVATAETVLRIIQSISSPKAEPFKRWLARVGYARILRDVDPEYVATRTAEKKAWAERIGHPRRCDTNQVHPGLGCCLFCGADSGEMCRSPA